MKCVCVVLLNDAVIRHHFYGHVVTLFVMSNVVMAVQILLFVKRVPHWFSNYFSPMMFFPTVWIYNRGIYSSLALRARLLRPSFVDSSLAIPYWIPKSTRYVSPSDAWKDRPFPSFCSFSNFSFDKCLLTFRAQSKVSTGEMLCFSVASCSVKRGRWSSVECFLLWSRFWNWFSLLRKRTRCRQLTWCVQIWAT